MLTHTSPAVGMIVVKEPPADVAVLQDAVKRGAN